MTRSAKHSISFGIVILFAAIMAFPAAIFDALFGGPNEVLRRRDLKK